MAKRRMRRTKQNGRGRESTTGALSGTAKDMSVSAVKVATETAKAALAEMRDLGRTIADMAAPAMRQSVKTANQVTRTAIDSTRQAASTARPTTPRKRTKRRAA